MHPKLDDDFDLRARAELSLAYETGEPPGALFRDTPWYSRRWVQGCCVLMFVAGALLGSLLAVRPHELVRGAIEHEYYERTLRGSFMESSTLLAHLGLEKGKPVPGYPQLMRPCDIDGKLAFHLTTFFEKGGIVTVFAFDQPVNLKEDQGWWGNVHWQVVTGRDGRPLILVAEKKKALGVAYRVFSESPA